MVRTAWVRCQAAQTEVLLLLPLPTCFTARCREAPMSGRGGKRRLFNLLFRRA